MTDRSTIQRDAQLTYSVAPADNDWLNADARIYWSEARINAQNPDATGEFRKQTTTGGKIDNRTRLFSDTFAAHLLTYGGEYYRQEQNQREPLPVSHRRKLISAPAGYRTKSPCVTCR